MAKRITTPTEVAKVVAPKKPRAVKIIPDTSAVELLQHTITELETWNYTLQKDLEFMTSMSHKLSKTNTILFLYTVVLSVSASYFYFV